MRALLQPVIARELGVVLLKPGRELMELFTTGRVLIERQPGSMAGYQTGRVSDARQPLAENEQLRRFLLNEKVLTAAGGISGLDYWLLKYGDGHCQYAHSDYHYHELTIMHHEPGSILLCGYCDNSASMKLLTPTQDSRDIINAAVKCLDKIWKDGHRYQKAGIMLGDFFSQGVAQLNLFDENAPRAGSERLMEVLDHLNAKDGKGTLYFAGQGIQQQWQMKRDMLSPRYTTRYADLLTVR